MFNIMYLSYLQAIALICIHYLVIDHHIPRMALADPPDQCNRETELSDCEFEVPRQDCIQALTNKKAAVCIEIDNNTAQCQDCQGQNVTLSKCDGGSMSMTAVKCNLPDTGPPCSKITLCSIKQITPTKPTTKSTEIKGKGTTSTTTTERSLPTTPTSMSIVTSAVVGTVGGLLVIVAILLIITIWLTVVIQRKRNSTSRQNNNVNSFENPTYDDGDARKNGAANSMQTTVHLDHTSTSHDEPVYHTLESPPESNNLAATKVSRHHEYETMPRYSSPATEDTISTTLTANTYNKDGPQPYEVVEIKLKQGAEEPLDQATVTAHPNASYAGTMSDAKLDVIQEVDESNEYSTLDVSVQDYAILEPHIRNEHTNQNDNNFESDDYARLDHK